MSPPADLIKAIRTGLLSEVIAALDAGAPVVVRGAGFLNDGDLVRVASGPERSEEKPAAAPANQAQPAIK